jgi:hypothetical protein
MLGIYAHLLAIVLILSGTAALALIRGVGLGVGMFQPSSATIFASVGFSRRGLRHHPSRALPALGIAGSVLHERPRVSL